MLNTFDVSLHYSIHISTSSPGKLKDLNSGQYVTGQESQEILAWNLHARESQAFVAMVAPKVRPRPGFPLGWVAEVAIKARLWPGLTAFSRPYFSGKPGQKPGKPGLVGLCQACRAFGRTPDARVLYCNPWLTNLDTNCNLLRTLLTLSRQHKYLTTTD